MNTRVSHPYAILGGEEGRDVCTTILVRAKLAVKGTVTLEFRAIGFHTERLGNVAVILVGAELTAIAGESADITFSSQLLSLYSV